MKKTGIVFSIIISIALFSFAHAQIYGPDFVGPQQDPYAQYQIGQNQRCGPQGDGSYVLCESVGGIISQTQTNFAAFLREIYNLAFILAGTVAFVRIVYGGVLYSWSGVVDRKKEAMGIFKNVAIGMGLLMGSYAVLNTINPALTMLKLPTPVEGRPQSSLPADKGPLGEGATMIGTLDKAINTIRQENIDRINALDMFNSGTIERQATIDLINNQISTIGTPQTPAERSRVAELQQMLIQVQNDEAETRAAADAVTNTPPRQYQRTKTTP